MKTSIDLVRTHGQSEWVRGHERTEYDFLIDFFEFMLENRDFMLEIMFLMFERLCLR